MNKRVKKKNIKNIIKNVQKMTLNENEFLVFKYDENKYRLDFIAEFMQMIRDNVTGRVIGIPNDIKMIKVEEK